MSGMECLLSLVMFVANCSPYDLYGKGASYSEHSYLVTVGFVAPLSPQYHRLLDMETFGHVTHGWRGN